VPEGESYRLTATFPEALGRFVVHKGSIAVDGISLTIAALDGNRFDVQIIPFTWEHTNLRAARAGNAVNIECDILGKYVVRALDRRGA
jgi:riboflavin synthase